MLVLSRERDESIVLTLTSDLPKGTAIRVLVADVARGRARIGIDAPLSIQILRGELLIDSPEAIVSHDLLDPSHPDFGRDYA